MEKNGKFSETLTVTETVGGNPSWFRGARYYWAEASLSFAYALACVEVVSENPERACMLYESLEAMIRYH
jgi:hypothetical protein